MASLVDDVELIVSELVTNAFKATAEMDPQYPLTLRLFVNPTVLRIEVWDASPELPQPRRATSDATSGRGLMIVEALSSEWGARYGTQGGKCTWVHIAL